MYRETDKIHILYIHFEENSADVDVILQRKYLIYNIFRPNGKNIEDMRVDFLRKKRTS